MPKNLKICTIPGDGIGPEVMSACLEVLRALPAEIELVPAEMGLSCFKKTGEYLPDETISAIKECDSTLFGAITTPKDAAAANYESPLLRLRKELELFANVRPVKTIFNSGLSGVSSFVGRGKSGNDDDSKIDLAVIRENTEGMYTQIEVEDKEKEQITTHRIVSRAACERIVRYAFEYAKKNKRGKITCVHKANVLRKSDGLFKRVFYDVAADYPAIKADDCFVDTAALNLMVAPRNFDVIVTLNLYGDILSDEAAGLIGGLGFAPSGNIGAKYSIFEPVHGSAPDIAGKNIANPTAMILSAAMMFEHIGAGGHADAIRGVVAHLYKKGAITVDLGGKIGTKEFASMAADYIGKLKI